MTGVMCPPPAFASREAQVRAAALRGLRGLTRHVGAPGSRLGDRSGDDTRRGVSHRELNANAVELKADLSARTTRWGVSPAAGQRLSPRWAPRGDTLPSPVTLQGLCPPSTRTSTNSSRARRGDQVRHVLEGAVPSAGGWQTCGDQAVPSHWASSAPPPQDTLQGPWRTRPAPRGRFALPSTSATGAAPPAPRSPRQP